VRRIKSERWQLVGEEPMKLSNDWGYWFGWFTAGVVAVAAVGAYSAFAFSREVICTGAQDEHCVREWVSALGGWLALAAALPTVGILLMQVTEANRHHRDNAMMSLRRKRSICERIIQLNDEYVRYIKGSEESWATVTGRMPNRNESRAKKDILDELKLLKIVLEVDQFQSFENEIDITRISATRLNGMITEVIDQVSREGDELMYPEIGFVGHRIIRLYEYAEVLHADGARRAADFLADTDHLVPARV